MYEIVKGSSKTFKSSISAIFAQQSPPSCSDLWLPIPRYEMKNMITGVVIGHVERASMRKQSYKRSSP